MSDHFTPKLDAGTIADLEEVCGPGSEMVAMVRRLNAPPRPPPPPREHEPPVVWQSARHRRLAEALSDANDCCCGDSSGADGWHEAEGVPRSTGLSLAEAMELLDDYADGRGRFGSWEEVFEQFARIRDGVRAGVDDLRAKAADAKGVASKSVSETAWRGLVDLVLNEPNAVADLREMAAQAEAAFPGVDVAAALATSSGWGHKRGAVVERDSQESLLAELAAGPRPAVVTFTRGPAPTRPCICGGTVSSPPQNIALHLSDHGGPMGIGCSEACANADLDRKLSKESSDG